MEVECLIQRGLAISQMPFEIVEIKGRGHPDTICDLICEQVVDDLLRFYETECGRPLHYNIDKALLVGGRASPRFGGGTVDESVVHRIRPNNIKTALITAGRMILRVDENFSKTQ